MRRHFDILNAAILLVIVWGLFSLAAVTTNSDITPAEDLNDAVASTVAYKFSDPVLSADRDELMLAHSNHLPAETTLPATDSLD